MFTLNHKEVQMIIKEKIDFGHKVWQKANVLESALYTLKHNGRLMEAAVFASVAVGCVISAIML